MGSWSGLTHSKHPHIRQDASLIRYARAHARHVQEELQGPWHDQAIDLPQDLQGRRHRRHQGQLCPAEGYAAQVLPRPNRLIYNVSKSAVGIIVYKVVGNRYMEKRVNIKVEHVRHSKCRDDFIRRVKENAAAKKEAKEKGTQVNVK